MLRVVKPKTKRAKRALDAKAPKVHENVKKALLLQGTKSSAVLKEVLTDLHHLKRWGGNSMKLSRKNENVRPFEAGGEASLEFLAQKADCSLFMFASHSKKRPHNLVIGRMFDFHVYDMVEVGIERMKSIKDLKGGGKYSPQVGSKPCFAFIGEGFETNPVLAQLKSIFLDFFRGEVVSSINLAGLDRVFVCIAEGEKVLFRHCAIRLKKSGTRFPKVELIEVGPSLDLVVRRNRQPGDDLRKAAMRKPAVKSGKKEKNVESSEVGGKTGRIFMPKQDVGSMALRKMKGLKRERRQEAAIRKGKAPPAPEAKGDAEGTPGGSAGTKRRRERDDGQDED